ncbi:MAG: zinc ribbon domain-containing protein [Methanomassiliicoccales archaeon]|nr:zinc ribbon domain-containing protein [Methanomassiliicoccales archaeon]NYT15117.1 zinc ribbon domain-containing protein [Methanomassiliicoccales archaeon]
MVFCPKCGESLDESWEYCPSCGHQLYLTCPHCHADIHPGSRFCSKCSNPVSSQDPIKPSSPPVVTYQKSKGDDMWILLILGIIFILVGLLIGICFFVGIIMMVVYVIIEFSRKPAEK